MNRRRRLQMLPGSHFCQQHLGNCRRRCTLKRRSPVWRKPLRSHRATQGFDRPPSRRHRLARLTVGVGARINRVAQHLVDGGVAGLQPTGSPSPDASRSGRRRPLRSEPQPHARAGPSPADRVKTEAIVVRTASSKWMRTSPSAYRRLHGRSRDHSFTAPSKRPLTTGRQWYGPRPPSAGYDRPSTASRENYHADRSYWFGSGEICLRDSRGRRSRQDGRAQDASPSCRISIFRKPTHLPCWHGGL